MKTANLKPKITAIAPWFGSKRSMGHIIAEELGKYSMLVIPFCGSLAPIFDLEPCANETVNDMHQLLINLARVLAHPKKAEYLYDRTMKTLFSVDLYYQSLQWLEEYDRTMFNPDSSGGSWHQCEEAAYHYLVVSWMGRNGTSGCDRIIFSPAIRYTPGGGSPSTRWRSVAESIPAWHERLRNLTILCMDAFDLMEKIEDSPKVAIYCDPPYMSETMGTSSTTYVHSFNEKDNPLLGERNDHERLALALSRFKKARVVVSYYDHPRLDRLYPGWTKRLCYKQKNLHVQNRRGVGKCEAPEVLMINGPSYAV